MTASAASDLPVVLAPEGPVGEPDVASVGQAPLVQRPALQRTRVRDAAARRCEHDAARIGGPACQRGAHLLGHELSPVLVRFHDAGRSAEADVGLGDAVHGRGRRIADRAQHFARRVRSAVAVAELREIDDDGARAGSAATRATSSGNGRPERNSTGRCSALRRQRLRAPAARLFCPDPTRRRPRRCGARRAAGAGRARWCRRRPGRATTAVALGGRVSGRMSSPGKPWNTSRAPGQSCSPCRLKNSSAGIENVTTTSMRTRAVLLLEQRQELGLQRFQRKALRVERLGEEDDPPRGFLGEARAHGAVDGQVGRKVGIDAVEDEDARFFVGGVRRRNRDAHAQGHAQHACHGSSPFHRHFIAARTSSCPGPIMLAARTDELGFAEAGGHESPNAGPVRRTRQGRSSGGTRTRTRTRIPDPADLAPSGAAGPAASRARRCRRVVVADRGEGARIATRGGAGPGPAHPRCRLPMSTTSSASAAIRSRPAMAAVAPRAGDGRAHRADGARRLQRHHVQAPGRDLALLQARRQVHGAHRRARTASSPTSRSSYTFGVAPLQQYLIALPGGRLQPLQIAWDSERRRWFHLLPDEKAPPGDVLHWTGRYQTAQHDVHRLPHHRLREALRRRRRHLRVALGRDRTCRASRATGRASGMCSGRSAPSRARPRRTWPASATA